MSFHRSASHRPGIALGLTLFMVACAAGCAGHSAHRARVSTDVARALHQHASHVDVIVDGSRGTIDRLARDYHAQVVRYLAGSGVLRLSARNVDAMRQDPAVGYIAGDAPVHATAFEVTPEAIGADQVWNGTWPEATWGSHGLNGSGITVAVIDSGIANARALQGRVLASHDFTGEGQLDLGAITATITENPLSLSALLQTLVGTVKSVLNTATSLLGGLLGGNGTHHGNVNDDGYGHGTHVAGLIAGLPVNDAALSSPYSGIAPGARLLDLKVLDSHGEGNTSDVIAAIDWAIANRKTYGIRVLNLSIGRPVYSSWQDDPLDQAVEQATQAGIVVVAAAGNLGQTSDGKTVFGGITSPGNAPDALTVGALNTFGTIARSDDGVTTYSSRGPTYIDSLIKPDLVAPGNKEATVEASGSYHIQT